MFEDTHRPNYVNVVDEDEFICIWEYGWDKVED